MLPIQARTCLSRVSICLQVVPCVRVQVFTWGIGTALGIGSSRSHWSPQEVTDGIAAAADELGTPAKISCGGGFTALVMSKGAVFTWGKWTHGRLGVCMCVRARACVCACVCVCVLA